MSWLRHMKTTQERRRWCADEELLREYPKLKLRARRSFSNLPSYYDDIPTSNGYDRSWKKHRNTQWGVIRSKKQKSKGERGVFETPMVIMHSNRFFFWDWYPRRGARRQLYPFRVRFKYIKNKTA